MSELTFAQYEESAQALRRRLGNFRPEVLLILGSGLGFLADEVRDSMAIPYAQIPHFGTSTAPGHKGRLVFGALADRQVAVMQGRLHTYEGYSMEQVSLAVRVARLLGAKRLVVTNAAGAVNTDYHAGELMLITDHIKLFGTGPLTGANLSEFGPRFPDMSHVYTPALQQVARQAARDLGIRLNEGVYMYFPGPQYETPAEVRAARILGADGARGHHRRPLRHGGAGPAAVHQPGRRGAGPAPERAGGPGCCGSGRAPVLLVGAGVPAADVT